MYIHDTLQSRHFNRGHRAAINFSAAPQSAFTALLCYAKITPAPLHRSDFGLATSGGGEAAGRRPEFALSDFRRVSAATTLPTVNMLMMASS
jgi:hypothetical protein